MVYEERFGKENHSNEDINEVVTRDIEEIPDHDLLLVDFLVKIIQLQQHCIIQKA